MNCKICNLEFKNLKFLALHITHSHKITSKDYYIKYINSNNKCKMCNVDTNFINMSKGFRIYCSPKCRNADPEYKNKIKSTNLEKYGFESHFHNLDIKEKIRKSNIDKYGVENAFQLEKTRQKHHQTMLDRYGVTHQSKIPEVKDKL